MRTEKKKNRKGEKQKRRKTEKKKNRKGENMQCKNCEEEIDEDVNFCPECGFNLEKAKKELADILKLKEEEKIAKKAIRDGLRIESKTTEGKKSSTWPTKVLVLSILAILLFVGLSSSIPVYNTEYYTEPIYGTIYYGTLTDSKSWLNGGDDVYTFDNAITYDLLYTRTAGRREYMFTITNFGGTKSYYYDIDIWNIREKPGIVRYEQKTRQVCIQNCN